MPFPPDPDLKPIVPPPGSPDDPARHAAAVAAAPGVSARPRIEPADPRAWSTSLTLKHPLIVDGERLEEVTIRRLTGADVGELVLGGAADTSLNVLARARMAGLHPDVIEAFSADDGEAFAAACRPLLPASLVALEEQFLADVQAQI
ncbi:phage tail assembly protein [Bosea minatitlanensis]|uniref:Phage tail assembly protein n=1 Tax=Bosea minatitlanensis TaxID=128782 RepID=A0ABW0F342_9HYPH|nr:phage tail assembly protein [Bosea minatitlanensis]MCT4491816.1 phage tail assembly protein [Bosea minatitlanensis]